MSENKNIIGQRIIELSRQKRMSYYMIANRSGVSIKIVMHIIHGEIENPDIYTLIKICDGLEITISEFLDIDEFRKSSVN